MKKLLKGKKGQAQKREKAGDNERTQFSSVGRNWRLCKLGRKRLKENKGKGRDQNFLTDSGKKTRQRRGTQVEH